MAIKIKTPRIQPDNTKKDSQDETDSVADALDGITTGDNIVLSRSTVRYVLTAISFFIAGYLVAWGLFVVAGGSASLETVRVAVQQALATAIVAAPVQSRNAAVAQPSTADPNKRYPVSVADSPSLGPDSAPVTLVEFSDFQCPFCEQFFLQTEKALLQKYQGKIRFVYRNFPLSDIHPYAQSAAEAAQCAYEQNKFWEYHDLLFQNQAQLGQDNLYLSDAKQLNLDLTAFTACLNSHKYAEKVQNDYGEGVALGINGTPTFFVNGRILVGAQPLSVFSAYINAELAAATPASTPPIRLSR
ncbi:MAG: DsbA family protein [Aggregatilineales bacterium]